MNLRIVSKEPWPAEEVSTRNCFNAKGHPEKNTVVCGCGYELKATYNSVVGRPKLQPVCEGCPKFDNSWEVPNG